MNPKIVHTVLEMLHDRGYKIEDRDDSIQGIRNGSTIKIYYCDQPKIGIKHINEVIEDMETNNIDKGIFIYTGNVSSFAKQLLVDNKNSLQYFNEDELSFNITHHSFVPEHKIMSHETKMSIIKKYKVKEKQLPWIHNSDPVVKYHGGCIGDLFRIVRNSKDGLSITYRICV